MQQQTVPDTLGSNCKKSDCQQWTAAMMASNRYRLPMHQYTEHPFCTQEKLTCAICSNSHTKQKKQGFLLAINIARDFRNRNKMRNLLQQQWILSELTVFLQITQSVVESLPTHVAEHLRRWRKKRHRHSIQIAAVQLDTRPCTYTLMPLLNTRCPPKNSLIYPNLQRTATNLFSTSHSYRRTTDIYD